VNSKQCAKENSPEARQRMLDRNAARCSAAVDWKNSRIIETEFGRDTNPLRDFGIPARSNPIARYRASAADLRELSALVRRHAPKSTKSQSVAFDAAETAYLFPNQLVCDAIPALETKLYSRQKNPSRQSSWAGLVFYLRNLKPGTRIRDCNQKVLTEFVGELHRNKL